jgi:amidase
MASLARETQWMDAVAQAELVRTKQVTPGELLEAALERTVQLNGALNAVNYQWADRARDRARQLESAPDAPLRGVPFILKDLHAALTGTPISNGNRALRDANYVTDYSTELVNRYVAAGLNIFGRGSSPEFGSVPVTEARHATHMTSHERRVGRAAVALRRSRPELSQPPTRAMVVDRFVFPHRAAASLV